MPKFQYKINQNGSIRSGYINSDSLHNASVELGRQGGIIIALREVTSEETSSAFAQNIERMSERFFIFSGQIELCLRQLSSLLHAGVPILDALLAVGGQAAPRLRKVYFRLAEKVRRGYSMKRSLQEEASCFGDITIGLVGVGEANGTLDEMFRYAADLMERGRRVRSQITQAFAYPAIVMLVAAGVSYFLVVHVLPKIIAFISKQAKSIELPLPTKMLLVVNDFIWAYGSYIVLIPILLAALFVFMRRNAAMCERIDYFCLFIPLIGKAYREHSNTMWCRTLGALLQSGVGLLAAIELVEGVMGNKHYAAQLHKIYNMVKQGDSVSKGIASTTLAKLCPMVLAMVAVSEKSGSLDVSLLHVADYCEEQLTRRVSLLGKFIEPVIFVFIGGIVGFIYFAFFLAMLAATKSAI